MYMGIHLGLYVVSLCHGDATGLTWFLWLIFVISRGGCGWGGGAVSGRAHWGFRGARFFIGVE